LKAKEAEKPFQTLGEAIDEAKEKLKNTLSTDEETEVDVNVVPNSPKIEVPVKPIIGTGTWKDIDDLIGPMLEKTI